MDVNPERVTNSREVYSRGKIIKIKRGILDQSLQNFKLTGETDEKSYGQAFTQV